MAPALVQIRLWLRRTVLKIADKMDTYDMGFESVVEGSDLLPAHVPACGVVESFRYLLPGAKKVFNINTIM